MNNDTSHDKDQKKQRPRGGVSRRNVVLTGTSALAAAGVLSAAQTTSAQNQEKAQLPPRRQVPAAQTQTIDTRIGKLDFELGVPTQKTAVKLYDEMDFQRAVQCYLWGLPIVGVEQSKQGFVHDTGVTSGDLALYDDFRSKSTILGANNSTPYIGGFIDLAKDGPVVMDYPAGATAGALIDWWERPVTDVGLPGADKGQGAKYLFVGPGQETPAGLRAIESSTLAL